VNKANLVITGVSADSRVYDATTVATLSGTAVVSALSGDVVTLAGTAVGTFASKNAGSQNVSVAGNTLSGTDAGNYNLLQQTGFSAIISKADAVVTANSSTGVYSGVNQSVSGFTITGLVGGETAAVLTSVTASGTGKNAGTYNVVATGIDVNYKLTLNNGFFAIAKAALNLNATSDSKVYDGNTISVGTVAVSGLVGGDTVTSTGQAFFSKNVLGTGASKLQVNSGYVVADGNNGGNYSVTTNSATGNISRLYSVAWIGGATGNWFDAANWQGGAVPDLSNVANVYIPAGVNVNFNNAAASSVLQSGLVQVDSIGNLGALNMLQGSLNVANNLTLESLTQSGGAMGGTGNFTVKRFNQTGGSVGNTGNFSAENAFTQTDAGIVAVGGNIAIAQLSGDLNTNSLSGNNISLTANNGAAILGAVIARGVLSISAASNITQTSNSIVTSGSASTLASSNGDIVLPNSRNDQDGVVVASAINITLTDASNPVFALRATGNSTLVSGGNLVVSGSSNNLTTTSINGTTSFNATTVNGNLSTTSFGSVSQTSPVTVNGSASINTNGNDLTTIVSDKATAAATSAKAAVDAQALIDATAKAIADAVAKANANAKVTAEAAVANVSASLTSVLSGGSLAATNSKDVSVATIHSSNEESADVSSD